jgi:hypothetical protein
VDWSRRSRSARSFRSTPTCVDTSTVHLIVHPSSKPGMTIPMATRCCLPLINQVDIAGLAPWFLRTAAASKPITMVHDPSPPVITDLVRNRWLPGLAGDVRHPPGKFDDPQ